MYQIGVFSKMNKITTKTLRYYDEISLLKPVHIDASTGYRYYSSEQIFELNTIISLKQMGFNLNEIKDIIKKHIPIDIILKRKEKELHLKQKEINRQLSQVQNYLKRTKEEFPMKYNPMIKSLPEVIVASMRFIAKNYDEYFTVIPKMGEEMKRQGAKCAIPEYCFNIYHDKEYKEENIDVEVCEAVVDYCEDSETVKYKKINKVDEAVCVTHKGPYNKLREAYVFIYEWIKDNGYIIIGEPRESYIDGIWNKDNEEDWLTEIQIPINTK